MRTPPHEVLLWPSWSVHLLHGYLSREPAPEERVEIAVAQVSQLLQRGIATVQVKKLEKPEKLVKFLHFADPWKFEPDTGDEDIDHDIRALRDALPKTLRVRKRDPG